MLLSSSIAPDQAEDGTYKQESKTTVLYQAFGNGQCRGSGCDQRSCGLRSQRTLQAYLTNSITYIHCNMLQCHQQERGCSTCTQTQAPGHFGPVGLQPGSCPLACMLTTTLMCCVSCLQEAIQEHPYPLSAATHKLMGGSTSAKTAVQQVPKQAQNLAASRAASTQQQQQTVLQKKLLSPRGVSHCRSWVCLLTACVSQWPVPTAWCFCRPHLWQHTCESP